MFTMLITLMFLFAFQESPSGFDPGTFATAAIPIAGALIAAFAAWGFDLSKSRVASLFGILAAVYGAAGPYLGLVGGRFGVGLMIAGVIVTALNERLQGGTSKQLLALLCAGSLLVATVACGPPSRKTLERLHGAALVVQNTLRVNATLPDDLLAEKIITLEQYALVKEIVAQVDTGAGNVVDGLALALTAEKPSLKDLAPAVAGIIGNLRNLRSLVNVLRVQQFLSAVEIGLRVLGSYFALQVAEAREMGLSDKQICKQLGLPYDSKRFELLASSYDGRRFEEYALAAGV